MSRSGYNDDYEQWAMIRWRGAVKSAINGRRGQDFLKELLTAMDAMPMQKKVLITAELQNADGCFCALGVLGAARGMDLSEIDQQDNFLVAEAFGVARALALEIMFENDEGVSAWRETNEQRWVRMRAWVASKIKQ